MVAEPEAYVKNRVLAPERQAFKALVLRGNDTLTVRGIQKVVEYAHEGLPIIFSGGMPFNLSGYNASGSAYVRSALASIADLNNVHQVPAEDLSASLLDLGLSPRTKTEADRILYTYWREDPRQNKTYVFVYNDAWDSELGLGGANGSVTFQTTGVPYTYDAWTGDQTAIVGYSQTDASTTIPFSLAGNQSTIVAFHHDEKASCPRHPHEMPPGIYGMVAKDDDIWMKSGHNAQPMHLPNGTSYNPPSASAPLNLTSWILTVESWGPPDDIYADQTVSVRTNSSCKLHSLQPWNAISDALRNASGRGFYRTTFSWPPADGRADGAVLDLGSVINTARAWVNGQQLPPLDPTHAQSDISKFLKKGDNEVLIVVATTLGNALRPYWDVLRSSSTTANGPLPIVQDYGLVSDVLVKPYRSVIIRV